MAAEVLVGMDLEESSVVAARLIPAPVEVKEMECG